MTNLLPDVSLLAAGSNAALITFMVYTLAVFGLAAISNRLLQKKSFLSEYFLGSRSLGVWAFALTFAATSASGGSFTGFPSKIYTHGWILGLWIGSYIVVPICAMGLLGKRINQVARISGSITVPDVIRDRFRSPSFGLLAVSLIVFFMTFNLIAQFKAGSEILGTLLQDVPEFKSAVGWMSNIKSDVTFLGINNVDGAYLLCLLTFAVAVIVYTTYGGFHAVVWTDVMQGVVMVVGVLLMLPLAISAVGGLGNATDEMSRMTPPRVGFIELEVAAPSDDVALVSPWIALPGERDQPRLMRVSRSVTIHRDESKATDVKVVELTTPEEIDRQLTKLRTDGRNIVDGLRAEIAESSSQLVVIRGDDDATAAIVQRIDNLEASIERVESQIAALDSNRPALLFSTRLDFVSATPVVMKSYTYGAGMKGVYVTGPGPSPPKLPETAAEVDPDVPEEAGGGDPGGVSTEAVREHREIDGFLPFSIAISFFFMWAISGAGQPSSMVRLMAFNNTVTLRRAIFTVAIYYSLIYFPLVIIFCCARVMLPGMDLESDRIMPQMAVTLTTNIGQGWLAGLLVAAPFAAVMSTVDSFLLMISSALVRDIYQRNINPDVSEKGVKRLSYLFTFMVGAGAMLGAVNPPQFLQDIIVYTGSGLAACFLGPMVFALYWPRSNTIGCMAGMLAGFAAHLGMYVAGIFTNGSFFKPHQLFSFNPIIVGLVVSFATCYIVARLTSPPPDDLVKKYFYKRITDG